MQLSTTETIRGETLDETLGLVKGNTVRARNIGRDLTQSIRNITGGELKSSSGLMTQSRDEAVDRLTEAAEELGAAEILAYGTAVTLE